MASQDHRAAAGSEPPRGSIAASCGDVLYLSAASSVDSGGRLVAAGDAVTQARVTLDNVRRMLAGAGMSLADTVYTRVFFRDIDDRAKINPVRQKLFGSTRPGSTAVEIGDLAIPGALIAIEAIACKPSGGGARRQEVAAPGLYGALPHTHFSDVVRCGDFAWLCGTVALDQDENVIGKGDIGAQACQVMHNMRAMLDAVDMGFEDVAKIAVYLEDLDQQPVIEPALREGFGNHRPAGTIIGVRRLALPDVRIEIDAVAYKPSGGAPKRREISIDTLLPPADLCAHAVRCGDTLFISGLTAVDGNRRPVAGDAAAQAAQIGDNLALVLAAAGMEVADLVQSSVYLADIADRKVIERLHRRLLGSARPAITLLEAGGLGPPGARLALDAVAFRPGSAG